MKRTLLINAHTALLCFGTIVNAVIFILCWPYLHGFVAGLLYIGVFVVEWILTLLTQRSGASWTKKRYNVAYLCCYLVLAIAMSFALADKPLFYNAQDAALNLSVDSIIFNIVVLFFCALCTWAMGYSIRNRTVDDEFREFYYSQRIFDHDLSW